MSLAKKRFDSHQKRHEVLLAELMLHWSSFIWFWRQWKTKRVLLQKKMPRCICHCKKTIAWKAQCFSAYLAFARISPHKKTGFISFHAPPLESYGTNQMLSSKYQIFQGLNNIAYDMIHYISSWLFLNSIISNISCLKFLMHPCTVPTNRAAGFSVCSAWMSLWVWSPLCSTHHHHHLHLQLSCHICPGTSALISPQMTLGTTVHFVPLCNYC